MTLSTTVVEFRKVVGVWGLEWSSGESADVLAEIGLWGYFKGDLRSSPRSELSLTSFGVNWRWRLEVGNIKTGL